MGYLFVTEYMIMNEDTNSIAAAAVDSSLMRAKGSVWHKSSMKKGVAPCPAGIDTDARWWGYSHTKEGWISGYKLHLTCTAGERL